MGLSVVRLRRSEAKESGTLDAGPLALNTLGDPQGTLRFAQVINATDLTSGKTPFADACLEHSFSTSPSHCKNVILAPMRRQTSAVESSTRLL